LVLFSLLAGCENSTAPETEGVQVPVSTDYLADQLGDKNGTASQEEINFLTDYFQSNSEMWVITNCMARSGNSVHADSVKKLFTVQSEPYESEKSLREKNKNLSIKTQWIGITVITGRNFYYITKIFRSPGSNFANAMWDALKIVR